MSIVPQTLTERYRPRRLDDFLGNDEVVRRIRSVLTSGDIYSWNAVMISGRVGVGKTTLARLIAHHMNCDERSVCGKCGGCQKASFFAREHNLADNRDVDYLRYLIQESQPGLYDLVDMGLPRKRVLICDEVQNLTKVAVQAWYKALEAPEGNVMWVLVTSEPDLIPEAVRSRCVRFELKRPFDGEIERYLINIGRSEGLILDDEFEGRIRRIVKSEVDVRSAVKRFEGEVIPDFRSASIG